PPEPCSAKPPTLSLHDALPILGRAEVQDEEVADAVVQGAEAGVELLAVGLVVRPVPQPGAQLVEGDHHQRQPRRLQRLDEPTRLDRKSTRLNSSHVESSYAVFC